MFKDRKNGLFTTQPIFTKDSITFQQKELDIIDTIEEILNENIKVVRDVPKILGNKAFDDYIKRILVGEKEEIADIRPDILKIVKSSSFY